MTSYSRQKDYQTERQETADPDQHKLELTTSALLPWKQVPCFSCIASPKFPLKEPALLLRSCTLTIHSKIELKQQAEFNCSWLLDFLLSKREKVAVMTDNVTRDHLQQCFSTGLLTNTHTLPIERCLLLRNSGENFWKCSWKIWGRSQFDLRTAY